MAGLILGGLHSSSGKTAVTSLLLAALAKRGQTVQPFKAGPDFIDPAYHNLFSERPCRNLDFWLMGGEAAVSAEVVQHTEDCPGLLEGVMGIFDGWTAASDSESTMHLARLLDWPIVLVVPCAKAGRSLAAALRGFIAEAGEGRIAGVILNQVSGSSHREYLEEAIKPLGLPVLGALPVDALLDWPERHLGLQAAQEGSMPSVSDLAEFAERHLHVEALWLLAKGDRADPQPAETLPVVTERRLRLAVARDEAFHFYYQANLDRFEIMPFSPLHDQALPEGADALAIGGGFPEIYAEPLSANRSLIAQIRAAVDSGLPVLAECGGLMYLAEYLEVEEQRHAMCGLVPGGVQMMPRLQNFGYCQAADQFSGHEFHYSSWREEESQAKLWQVRKRRSGESRTEGFRVQNLEATYVHTMWTPERFFPDSL